MSDSRNPKDIRDQVSVVFQEFGRYLAEGIFLTLPSEDLRYSAFGILIFRRKKEILSRREIRAYHVLVLNRIWSISTNPALMPWNSGYPMDVLPNNHRPWIS